MSSGLGVFQASGFRALVVVFQGLGLYRFRGCCALGEFRIFRLGLEVDRVLGLGSRV